MMLNGLLHYVDTVPKTSDVQQRVAVPKQCQQHILHSSHGGLLAGHFSGKRLYNTLCKKWWWERMYSDAIDYSRNCPSCVIVTGGGRVAKPPLCPIPWPVERPFQILGVDVMKLPKTTSGNSYDWYFRTICRWYSPFLIRSHLESLKF